MDEIYRIIEEKIRSAGYPVEISGRDIYNDICDQIDEQENGTYIMLSKFQENVVLEYRLTIMDENFNLEQITIKSPEGEFRAQFDD